MSDENGFIQAIRANRTDIAARCAYIDWLDEHDRHVDARLQAVLMEPDKDEHRLACATALDEEAEYLDRWVAQTKDRHFLISTDGSPAKQIKRAELQVVNYRRRASFIRVQCELARLPPCGFCGNRGHRYKAIRHHHGARVSEPCMHCQRWQLHERERELFAQEEVTHSWFGKAIELAVAGTEWNAYLSWFDRGFISHVSTSWFDEWCEHGDQIREETPLRTVTLTTQPEFYVHTRGVPVMMFAGIAGEVVYLDEREILLLREPNETLASVDAMRRAFLEKRWPGLAFELQIAWPTPSYAPGGGGGGAGGSGGVIVTGGAGAVAGVGGTVTLTGGAGGSSSSPGGGGAGGSSGGTAGANGHAGG